MVRIDLSVASDSSSLKNQVVRNLRKVAIFLYFPLHLFLPLTSMGRFILTTWARLLALTSATCASSSRCLPSSFHRICLLLDRILRPCIVLTRELFHRRSMGFNLGDLPPQILLGFHRSRIGSSRFDESSCPPCLRSSPLEQLRGSNLSIYLRFTDLRPMPKFSLGQSFTIQSFRSSTS